MSRTFRRKNYKSDWVRVGPKVWYDNRTGEIDTFWYTGNPTFNKEWIAKKAKIIPHTDAFRVTCVNKSWVKRAWSKWRRQHDRQEMHKALLEEYEPIWFTTKIDTWWWD